MNLLIWATVPIADTNRSIPDWRIAEGIGHRVAFSTAGLEWTPDAIVCMSISRMREAEASADYWPHVPLFVYQWDAYEWVWLRPRPSEYDYNRWGNLLKRAREIWVPSNCAGHRTEEWWGLKNWRTILSSAPCWDHDHVHDGGYALCTLREIPDPRWGWFERACDELAIKYYSSNHERTYTDYQDLVAGCRLLCSPLYELSTGGLTLLEGYRLGKPVLLSNSPYHGGADYMGERAWYFQHDDFEQFKQELWRMYYDTPPARPDQREWVDAHFSDARMVHDMLNRIACRVKNP